MGVQHLQKLHQHLDGDLDIRRVLQIVDFKNHADHLSGRKSKAMLFSEFSDLVASNSVSWQAFQLYCRGLATCVSEGELSQMVRVCQSTCNRLIFSARSTTYQLRV